MKLTKGFLGTVRHVRKTITFTGAAGAGATGTVVVFTITGRVLVNMFTAFASTGLTEAGATSTIAFGVTGSTAIFLAQLNSVDIDTDEWWNDTTPDVAAAQVDATAIDIAIAADIILTIGTQAVSAGVLVIDIWYTPITDNGALV